MVFSLSALKLVKPLGSSIITSITILLLILFSLCITLLIVIPYFSYCSSVLDPPVSSTNSEILEKIQHFALKMCSYKWNNGYLSLSQFLTIRPSRSISKLCLLYKVTNNFLHFPSDIFICKPLPSYASHHFDPLTFTIAFCHSSASQNSFVFLFSRCGIHLLIMKNVAYL